MESSHLKTAQPGGATGGRVVLVTQSSAHAFWLASALGNDAEVIPVAHDISQLELQIAALDLGVVVMDFSAPCTDEAVQLVSELRAVLPGVVMMGAGTAADPSSMRAALRCGVAEFVDWNASEAEACTAIKQQLNNPQRMPVIESAADTDIESGSFALPLLGARAGMGVTTLATHLTVMLQEMQAHDARGSTRRRQAARPFGASELPLEHVAHAALVDLGLPARDGLLYLNMAGDFSFVDAVQNVRRLDATLVESAFEKHSSGAAALAWPADLSLLREVSPTAAAGVVKTLKNLLKAQVVDLGGMTQADFLLPVLREGSKAWVVCDQSLGGIVSTAQLIKDLEGKGVDRNSLKLVLNRFNAQAGLPAKEVAHRLGLELVHVIPDRTTALLNAASSGQLLSQTLRGDPYVTAVRAMARALLGDPMETEKLVGTSPSILGQWAKRLRRGE